MRWCWLFSYDWHSNICCCRHAEFSLPRVCMCILHDSLADNDTTKQHNEVSAMFSFVLPSISFDRLIFCSAMLCCCSLFCTHSIYVSLVWFRVCMCDCSCRRDNVVCLLCWFRFSLPTTVSTFKSCLQHVNGIYWKCNGKYVNVLAHHEQPSNRMKMWNWNQTKTQTPKIMAIQISIGNHIAYRIRIGSGLLYAFCSIRAKSAFWNPFNWNWIVSSLFQPMNCFIWYGFYLSDGIKLDFVRPEHVWDEWKCIHFITKSIESITACSKLFTSIFVVFVFENFNYSQGSRSKGQTGRTEKKCWAEQLKARNTERNEINRNQISGAFVYIQFKWTHSAFAASVCFLQMESINFQCSIAFFSISKCSTFFPTAQNKGTILFRAKLRKTWNRFEMSECGCCQCYCCRFLCCCVYFMNFNCKLSV